MEVEFLGEEAVAMLSSRQTAILRFSPPTLHPTPPQLSPEVHQKLLSFVGSGLDGKDAELKVVGVTRRQGGGAEPFAHLLLRQVLRVDEESLAKMSEEIVQRAGLASRQQLRELFFKVDRSPEEASISLLFVCFQPSFTVVSSSSLSSAQFWQAFQAESIPSKSHLHHSFLSTLNEVCRPGDQCSLLDLGCGDGRISLEIIQSAKRSCQWMDLLGMDICEDGIRNANSLSRAADLHEFRSPNSKIKKQCTASFMVGDVTNFDLQLSDSECFDVVLCQLVISVVGGVDQRRALLACARKHLKEGGLLLISSSGASDHINEKYRDLYQRDLQITQEPRTYLSRGKDGEVLYSTHHFTVDELEGLIMEANFTNVYTIEESETSSRRPDEPAVFFYSTAVA